MLKHIRIKRGEIASIAAAAVVLAFVFSLVETVQSFLYFLGIMLIIIAGNSFGKKLIAYYYDTEIEITPVELKRYWFRTHDYLQRPFPFGIIFPVITTALTFGLVKWMGCLTFNPKTPVYKAARRHDKFDYNFSEITEWQIGVIATWGLVANLVMAIISIKAGYPEFAKLNIYYMFFNIIPFSSMDGAKMLFAHWLLWIVSAIIVLGATIIALVA